MRSTLPPVSHTQLANLYAAIHRCDKCILDPACEMADDPQRVIRKPIEEALEAEVMLLGESLGSKTQRRSGTPYINRDESMLETGRTLDNFLSRFNYTIRPGTQRRYVYSTDAVQRWPGLKPNGTKRDPSPREVANCAEWFEAEVALVRPRVLLVMGKPAAKHFFPRYLGRCIANLREVAGDRYEVEIANHTLYAYAIQHASPRAQGPERTATYERVGREIRDLLNP